MNLKTKIKKSLFMLSAVSFLVPTVIACSAANDNDNNNDSEAHIRQQINDFIATFNQIAPADKPLLTTLNDRSLPPNGSTIKSISDLDNLVNGTPFANLLTSANIEELINSLNIQVAVDSITISGYVTLNFSFSLENFGSFQASATLSGFIHPDQTLLSEIASIISSLSTINNPKIVESQFANQELNIDDLKSVTYLDDLVFGTPFSDAIKTLSLLGVTLSAKASAINNQGKVTFTITLEKGSFQAIATVVLGGFKVSNPDTPQENPLIVLASAIKSLSSQSQPIIIKDSQTPVPKADTLTSLEALDTLVGSSIFTNALNLPQGVTFSSEVGELTNNGDLEITLLLQMASQESVRAKIFLSGFAEAPSAQSVLDDLASRLEGISSQNAPLETILSDKNQKPNDNLLVNLGSLDNLVAGTPFSEQLSELINGVSISAIAQEIDSQGRVKIDITFAKDGLSSQAAIFLSGFEVIVPQFNLSRLAALLTNLSSQSAPLEIKSGLKNQVLQAETLTSLSVLDNLVANTPFSDAVGELPQGVTISALVDEVNPAGQVVITLTLESVNSQSAEAQIFLSGFEIQTITKELLRNLAEEITSKSSFRLPLNIKEELKNTKPDATSITSLENLNNLMQNNPFAEMLATFLQNITISARVQEISLQGVVEIFLTLEHGNLSQEAKVVVAGFKKPERIDLNAIANKISRLSTSTLRLPIILEERMQKPQAETLTSLSAFDALVANTPFSDAVGELPQGVVLSANVHDIDENGNLLIVLSLSHAASGRTEVNIYLSGFEKPAQTLLNDFVQKVSQTSPISNPLKIAVENSLLPPNANSLTSITSLDNLLGNNSFLDAAGPLPSNVQMSALVGEVDANGLLQITLTFSLNDLQKEAIIFLSGFLNRDERVLETLARAVKQVSPQESPLTTTLADKTQAPEASALTSIRSLDSLVGNTFFLSAAGLLPSEVTMSSNVGEISPSGLVTITITFSKGNLTRQAVVVLKGFISQEESKFNELPTLFARISSQNTPLITTLEDKSSKPQASSLTTLSALDALVQGTPFTTSIFSLPAGTRMMAVVNEIDVNGKLTINLTFRRNNQVVQATVFLSGFDSINQRRLNAFASTLALVSPQNAPLSVKLEKSQNPPLASSLTSIRSLDDLVAGSPFTTLAGNTPQGISMLVSVSSVSFTRQITITLTFSAPNLETRVVEVHLNGFSLDRDVVIQELDLINDALQSASLLGAPLVTTLEDKTREPQGILKSVTALDNLVAGTPFSQAIREQIGNFPDEWVDISVKSAKINDQGLLLLTVVLSDRLSTDNRQSTRIIALQGFTPPRRAFSDFVIQFQDLLSSQKVFATTLADRSQKPDVSNITSLGVLDSLLEGAPFSTHLLRLPQETTMSVTSSEITNNGQVILSITLRKRLLSSSGSFESLLTETLEVTLSGFISNAEKASLNRFIQELATVSPPSRPLKVKSEVQNEKPDASLLVDIASLDNLLPSRYFLSRVGFLPVGASLEAKVSDIQLNRQVNIELNIFKGGFRTQKVTITLEGFTLSAQALNHLLDQKLALLTQISNANAPLQTSLKNNPQLPSAQEFNTLSDLDQLVNGTPFSDAWNTTPINLSLEIVRQDADAQGTIFFKIILKDLQTNLSRSVFVPISGFQTPLQSLENLSLKLQSVSPREKPLANNLIDKQLKPEAANLTSISSLDNLVSGTPFSDLLNALPSNTVMSATVSDINEDGIVEIEINLLASVFRLNGVRDLIRKRVNIALSNFILPTTQATIDNLALNLAKVSPKEQPLSILESRNARIPDAASLSSIAILDNLVEDTPFTRGIGALPPDVTMKATVSEINLSKEVIVNVTFERVNLQTRTASFVLKGFALEAQKVSELVESYLNRLDTLSTTSNPLVTTLEDKTQSPLDENLKTWDDLDNLVAGTPFSDLMQEVPSEYKLVVTASKIDLNGDVTLTLVLANPTDFTFSSRKEIKISGFIPDPYDVQQKVLDDFAQKLLDVANIDVHLEAPILTFSIISSHLIPPSEASLSTIEGLDAIVEGTPFMDYAGPLPENVSMFAKLNGIAPNGRMPVKLTLSSIVQKDVEDIALLTSIVTITFFVVPANN